MTSRYGRRERTGDVMAPTLSRPRRDARAPGATASTLLGDSMSFAFTRTADAAAAFAVVEAGPGRDPIRRAVRVPLTLALLVAFAYCARTAWSVLNGLGQISIADMAHTLHVVSVRDLILCAVGWRLGRELLVALLRGRRSA